MAKLKANEMERMRELLHRGLFFIFDVTGDSFIDLDGVDVQIGIAYEVSGYGPHPSALSLNQNPYHTSEDIPLQDAAETIEQWQIDTADKEYLEELQEEWGDEWDAILREDIDGQAFTVTPQDAQWLLAGLSYSDNDKKKPMDIEFYHGDED